MAPVFEGVQLCSISDNSGQLQSSSPQIVKLEVKHDGQDSTVVIYTGTQDAMTFLLDVNTECSRVGRQSFMLTSQENSLLLRFPTTGAFSEFYGHVEDARHQTNTKKRRSMFQMRTDEASATQYFQFYSYLSQQQNMLQDYVRTATYQRAMLQNMEDFRGKVVMDVGAGSGILSFFAVQAGAAKVYAVEASSMAEHAETLIRANGLSGKVQMIRGKVEEVTVPEQVDVIISESMGYMLLNERMLESFLHAKKWLKPGGRMFPSRGDLHITPFMDEQLYMEQFNKANFWYQESFHGVNLSVLRDAAVNEYFRQPVVDTFDIRICMAKTEKYTVDFQTADETDLHRIEIPLRYEMLASGSIHGLAFWFDCAFIGTSETIWLSTAPTEPLTHWYQVRCLLRSPLFVKVGQVVSGVATLVANKRQSYEIMIELEIEGTGMSSRNTLDLKNPFFRYTGVTPAAPPGSHTGTSSPSDSYWQSLTLSTNVGNSTQVVPSNHVVAINGYDGNAANIMQSNLIPLANTACISHPTTVAGGTTVRQVGGVSTMPTPCSIGGGISPAAFSNQTTNANNMNYGGAAGGGGQYGGGAAGFGQGAMMQMQGGVMLPGQQVDGLNH
ncbi:PREDICTED: histone-arginine methyltransferase CARM1-like isoform X1 [Branchiostoma belcheri]|uniref:Histone-arginine methyltransferase CARM1 n=1 Tax=Branchiostoma belcheri TaxID=7741 RepID=A0A6P4YPK0_BRABE|nr:PREDICTED: histone-arginine methyltransferase CARM1-like isoform X1 [Branchiostoma belcheri]